MTACWPAAPSLAAQCGSRRGNAGGFLAEAELYPDG